MSIRREYGWRERAIAVASLGAATLARAAFRPDRATDPPPLEMQVLVALAVGESLVADPAQRTGTDWLSIALRLDQTRIEQLVGRLERANLVHRSADTQDADEIRWELAEDSDDDTVARELPIAVTDLGVEIVERWLRRTTLRYAGWPPERVDADDAIS